MAKNKKTSNLKGKSEASTELAASPVLMQGNRPEVDATSSAVAQQKTADNGGIMQRILSSENYALALAPGFYRFYAHIGILLAFEEAGCLRHTHVTGSSAGALVGGFLASGMKPSEMVSPVLGIKRADIWDMGGFGGLLKGELFESLIAANIPVQTFEECSVPLGVTTYDVFGFQTNVITNGNIARAVRTSCTFPGMFQPVYWDGHPHIDGGVWDHAGLMALPETMKRKPSPTTTTSNITKTASLSSSSSSSSSSSPSSSPVLCKFIPTSTKTTFHSENGNAAATNTYSVSTTITNPPKTKAPLPAVSAGSSASNAGFKCVETVRSKDARAALRGFTCEECAKFYEAMHQQGIYDLNDSQVRRDVLQRCSRHKSRHTPPSTPDGFWNLTLDTPDDWNTRV